MVVDAARTLRAVQDRVCAGKESREIRHCSERLGTVLFFCCCLNLSAICSSGLTSRDAVEANSNGGGLDREAAGQAAQHRLNRITFGLLAMEVYLFLQLHRFKLHTALCQRKGVHESTPHQFSVSLSVVKDIFELCSVM